MINVPVLINTFQKGLLLVVQYKYLKKCFEGFYSPASDPPHKIMWYWLYYSTQLASSFPPDQNGRAEMFCMCEFAASKGCVRGTSP